MSNLVLEEFVGSMTVADLCARMGCTVETLVGRCTQAATPASVKSTKPAKGTKETGDKPKSPGVNMRTAAGRQAFDATLLALLRGADGELSGRNIEQETGASPSQIRASITRLGKRVRTTGQTVARRYSARP